MQKIILIITLIAVFCLVPEFIAETFAQYNPPPTPPGDPIGATGVPIDGGLSALLAAGVTYAGKKLYNKKKKDKEEKVK